MKTCRKNGIVYCFFNFCPQSATFSTFAHKKPNLTQMKKEFKYLLAVYVKLEPYFCIKSCLLEVSILKK